MAYRCGDRYQMDLMPQSIAEYVGEDNPVRAYDFFVEALNFQQLGIDINLDKVGNSEYDPRSMFKLLIYGYSYGVKSSRKLERECYHNIAFIWVMGGLKPDHKTIAEFRRHNKKALKKVLHQCVQMCIKLNLIAGNVFFVDGTKIRTNAGRDRTHDRAYYEKLMSKLDSRIEQLLADCETTDQTEEGLFSYVVMDKEWTKSQNLKERIKEVLTSFESSERKHINQTDPDSSMMHSVQGSHTSYNVQSVVDDEHGLIVQAQATTDTNDSLQFARQIDQANALLDKPCKVACADAGYSDTVAMEKIDKQGIKVIVPSQRQALHEPESPFSKSHFTYDKEHDCYICPEGHRLLHSYTHKKKGKRQYRMEDKKFCHHCRHYGQGTKSERGRNIIRLRNEDIKLKLEAQ
jgi:transposase/ribosomal protein L33